MKFRKRVLSIVLLFAMIIAAIPVQSADAAYTPPYSVIKVGLNSPLRSTRPAIPSVTLGNSGGFLIGTYDSNRNFSQSSSTSSTSLSVSASSGTVVIKDSSGNTIASGSSTVAAIPKNSGATSYTLPSSSYGASYSYYGGFEFIASDNTMTAVNYVDIESYVMGVVPYEMSASWPKEALKAQAVCARTYAVYHFDTYKSRGFDVCNTTSSQVYYGVYTNSEYVSVLQDVINETAGQYILYNGSLISAYFHSSSGGATEDSENVWANALGYCRGVSDPYDTNNFVESVTLSPSDVYSKMKAKDSSFNLNDVSKITYQETSMGNMYSVTFTDSSGNAKTYTKENCRIKVCGAFFSKTSQRLSISVSNLSGDIEPIETQEAEDTEDVRDIIEEVEATGDVRDIIEEVEGITIVEEPEDEDITSEDSLSAEDESDGELLGDVELEEPVTIELMASKTYTFTKRGYGHNIGMSQWGANAMASAGYSYDKIISHYFTNVEIASSGNATPFGDVSTSSWYYNAVMFVYQSGLFQGTDYRTFAPEVSMTRGQLVTVLGRLSGVNSDNYYYSGAAVTTADKLNFRSSPDKSSNIITTLSKGTSVTVIGKSGEWYKVNYNGTEGYLSSNYVKVSNGFQDVPLSSYYSGYIQWAVETGVVSGYSTTSFGPDDAITREQVCTILNRYAQKTGKTMPSNNAEITFSDNGQISSWASEAVSTMQKAGVIQGKGNNMFAPLETSTRAQVSQMLMNYLQV